jgi:FeS assembly protein IscX
MAKTAFHWLDIDRIAEALADTYDEEDPYTVTFPRLRDMVERLEGFREQQGHPVNERILEAIQQAWDQELKDSTTG